MATVTIPLSLTIGSQQMSVYIGSFLFITGILGGILALVVFFSLQTFRQSSCAFYLIIKSIGNICYLILGLFPVIMNLAFGINSANISVVFCKFRIFNIQLGSLISVTCTCLAAIDQFLATCSNLRWHRWNTTKVARNVVIGVVIIWTIYAIPSFILFTHIPSPITGRNSCTTNNVGYINFYNFVHLPIIASSLPAAIMTLFGLLAYRNVRNIAYRTVPLVRRELDKQLTSMVLVQVVYEVIFLLTIIVQTIFNALIGAPTDTYTIAIVNLIRNLITLLYYFLFVGSFYIYICASKRFRQQFVYVLFTIHRNRCRRTNINQIEPQV